MTRWGDRPEIPRGVAAVLAALHFSEPGVISGLSDAEWRVALAYLDRAHLTLLFAASCGGSLPEWVRLRVARDLESNRERVRGLREAWDRIGAALDGAGVEVLVLKGFSHWGTYVAAPELRLQYDLDLFCPHRAPDARKAILALGYTPLAGRERYPTDHLPALVRETGWRWKGDFFDPEIPFSVEIHYRLWDERTEGFAVPGLELFWERRISKALAPADGLGYAALHLLRHLLRGDTRAGHVYELATFLHGHRADDTLWTDWQALHPQPLRRIEAIAFRLAAEWFDCALHPLAREEADALPGEIRRWLAYSAAAPVAAYFRPNKDELALHMCLLDSPRAKARVLWRRLVPGGVPAVPAGVGGRTRYVLSRAAFHGRALPATLSTMLRMRRR